MRLALACLLMLVATVLLSMSAPAVAQEEASPPRLHRHATTERSWAANAYWLESQSGVVLVDSLFLAPDVDALIATIRASGKPLAGILLTHAHIDHFGGIPRLRMAFGEVPVYATKATADAVLPLFERMQRAQWTKAFGEDFPREVFVPDRIVAPGATVEIAGMHFTFRDLGPVETGNNTIIENLERKLLFTGDATVFATAFYLGEGHSCSALAALQALRANEDPTRMVYSGHYAAMRLGAVLDDNLSQIRYLRKLMMEALSKPANRGPDGGLTESVRAQLVSASARHFAGHADYGFGPESFASDVNLPGLEAELRKELESGMGCPADAVPAGK